MSDSQIFDVFLELEDSIQPAPSLWDQVYSVDKRRGERGLPERNERTRKVIGLSLPTKEGS